MLNNVSKLSIGLLLASTVTIGLAACAPTNQPDPSANETLEAYEAPETLPADWPTEIPVLPGDLVVVNTPSTGGKENMFQVDVAVGTGETDGATAFAEAMRLLSEAGFQVSETLAQRPDNAKADHLSAYADGAAYHVTVSYIPQWDLIQYIAYHV